ncbi:MULTISPECIES: hypothetical protein [Arthrobacter]|uniref:DUF222 domain-containing protein n=2 Tax=Arthrobacter TaxID=1663 RepID=A0ABU9KH40_9MICC|nr:hypothetical protein [Arthrobacter sp. YJM1]MDP5225872.1 hypothetical protein [Arthrobacter sp. YJM1]
MAEVVLPADQVSAGRDLTNRECLVIATMLNNLARAVSDITNQAVGLGLRGGSRAEEDVNDPANSAFPAGGSCIRRAQEAVAFSCFTAQDHLRAFAAVLTVGSGGPAMSLATLARGAIEAFGKAHFLLQTDTAEALVVKQLRLAITEVEGSAAHSEFRRVSGEPVEKDEHIAELKALLGEHGVVYDKKKHSEHKVSITTLATAVINDSTPDAKGRASYSQLSAVAHAESPGTAQFIHVSPKNEVGYIRPRTVVLEYVGHLIATSDLVLAQMLGYFALEEEHQIWWKSVLEETWQLYFRLRREEETGGSCADR